MTSPSRGGKNTMKKKTVSKKRGQIAEENLLNTDRIWFRDSTNAKGLARRREFYHAPACSFYSTAAPRTLLCLKRRHSNNEYYQHTDHLRRLREREHDHSLFSIFQVKPFFETPRPHPSLNPSCLQFPSGLCVSRALRCKCPTRVLRVTSSSHRVGDYVPRGVTQCFPIFSAYYIQTDPAN